MVSMATSVRTPALATCTVKSVVMSVCVSMVTVHRSMDHVTAIQDIPDQLVIQVCHIQKCSRILVSLFTAHQLITFIIQPIVIIMQSALCITA